MDKKSIFSIVFAGVGSLGGLVAVASAIAGEVKTRNSCKKIAALIADDIFDAEGEIKDISDAVRRHLKESSYWKELSIKERGTVISMVTENLMNRRKEGLVC